MSSLVTGYSLLCRLLRNWLHALARHDDLAASVCAFATFGQLRYRVVRNSARSVAGQHPDLHDVLLARTLTIRFQERCNVFGRRNPGIISSARWVVSKLIWRLGIEGAMKPLRTLVAATGTENVPGRFLTPSGQRRSVTLLILNVCFTWLSCRQKALFALGGDNHTCMLLRSDEMTN